MTRIKITLCLALLLTSCVTVSSGAAPTDAPPLFVTSTLPPTKPGLTVPTPIPPTASPTLDPLTPRATSAPTCRDEAVFVEDVTIPDNTKLSKGEKFIKTWKLENTGTCTWMGYSAVFVSGEKMGAPDFVPLAETAPKSTVEISVALIAPSIDGAYIGVFGLRNKDGKVVPIGIENTFWVKVIVGDITTQAGTENCYYTTNPAYVQQLIDLINQARADVRGNPLSVSPQLTAAAQEHSLDMACNDFLAHSGSDGTWIGDRLRRAGYPYPSYFEILAIGLPQDAMNQWRNDPDHWAAVINPRISEIGVGYVYARTSSYGGYWTVDLGGP